MLLGVACLLFALGEPARANHNISNGFLPLRSGGSGSFEVFSDPPGCIATEITVTSTDPAIASVYAVDEDGEKLPDQDGTTATVTDVENQTFVVEAADVESIQFATLFVCWSEGEVEPCNQNFCPDPATSMTVLVEADPATIGANPHGGVGADPVATATGEFFLDPLVFLAPRGPMNLGFQIYWAARIRTDNNIVGRIGLAWLHNYDWEFEFPDFSGDNIAEIVTPRGRVIRFVKDTATGDWVRTQYDDIEFHLAESGTDRILTDPRNQYVYTFDATETFNVRLAKISNGRGDELTLTYDVNKRLSTVSDNYGRMLTYSYVINRLDNVTDGTRTISLTYSDGRLDTVTDAAGGVTSFAYDISDLGKPQITMVTYPKGNTPVTNTYDTEKRVLEQQDAVGNLYTFNYDEGTGETILGDPLGNSRTDTNDNDRRQTGYLDEGGQAVAMAYDEVGRRTQIVDRNGNVTSFAYHEPSGLVETVTHADGTVTMYEYTERIVGGGSARLDGTSTVYDLTGVTNGGGSTNSFSYDSNGYMTQWINADGEITTLDYNAGGQVTQITNPASGATSYTYDGVGNLASKTDPAGNTTAYAYDALDRCTMTTFADGTNASYTYGDCDCLLSSTDEAGGVTSCGYDANRNLTSVTTALGRTFSYTYDDMDRMTGGTDALGNVTSLTYDPVGNLVSRTDGGGVTTTYGYDDTRRVTSTTDGGGNTWTYSYDAEGNLTASVNPNGVSSSVSVDGMGRVTSATTGTGSTASVAYDASGRIAQAVGPLGNVATYLRDDLGRLLEISLSGESTVSYIRNAFGQITTATDSRGNDWASSFDSQGRLLSRTDPNGQQRSYTYDPRNRVSGVTFPGGGSSSLTYDPRGFLVTSAFSDGLLLEFDIDADGRLTSALNVTDGHSTSLTWDDGGRITSSNDCDMTYDGGGRMTSLTYSPGKTVNYTYDSRGRLTSVQDWAGGSTTLIYDPTGNIVSVERPNDVTTTYTYDADNRVLSVQHDALGSVSLTRDDRGQITSAVRDLPADATPEPSSASYSFDAANQTTSFTYDARGRVLDDGQRQYTWDLSSRLRSIDDGEDVTTLEYDPFGLPVLRRRGEETRIWIWNFGFGVSPSIVIERREVLAREAGSATRSGGTEDRLYHVYTPSGMLLYSIDAADDSRRFYHFDEMGNTALVSDDAGAVIASYAYSPYGEKLAETGSIENIFCYQGRFGVVQEGPLTIHRERVYDSRSKRFLSRDPIEGKDPRRINPYQAFFGNPLLFVDPTGEDGEEAEFSDYFYNKWPDREPGKLDVARVVDPVLDFWNWLTGKSEAIEKQREETKELFDRAKKRYEEEMERQRERKEAEERKKYTEPEGLQNPLPYSPFKVCACSECSKSRTDRNPTDTDPNRAPSLEQSGQPVPPLERLGWGDPNQYLYPMPEDGPAETPQPSVPLDSSPTSVPWEPENHSESPDCFRPADTTVRYTTIGRFLSIDGL